MKRIIADIEKNARETLRVELDEFEGRQLVAIRVWFKDGEALKPTRKGVSVSVKHLPALRRAIDEAEEIARREGLLSDRRAIRLSEAIGSRCRRCARQGMTDECSPGNHR